MQYSIDTVLSVNAMPVTSANIIVMATFSFCSSYSFFNVSETLTSESSIDDFASPPYRPPKAMSRMQLMMSAVPTRSLRETV